MTSIAITGMGIISALGIGKENFWKHIQAAKSGIKEITAFDTDSLKSNIAAYIDDFDPRAFLSPGTYRRMSRVSQMSVAASIEALADSGLDLSQTDRERIAVIMGTGYGSSEHVENFYKSFLSDGPRGAQPLFFPETVPNAPASHIAIFHQITGPNTTFCHNELSAENALAYGNNLLMTGQADTVLVGGADEFTEILQTCYNVFLNDTRTDGKEPVHPKPGKGIVLGEGAGILVMETREQALKRNAKIYGLMASGVISGGISRVGHYEADGKQMGHTMAAALHQADVSPEQVDQINISAHYLAELGPMEFKQVTRLFQKKDQPLRVSPLKYLMGSFGGAGILRAAATLLSIYYQRPLPVINAEELMPDTKNNINWQISKKQKINTALMTSSTFGGGTASLVFAKNSERQ